MVRTCMFVGIVFGRVEGFGRTCFRVCVPNSIREALSAHETEFDRVRVRERGEARAAATVSQPTAHRDLRAEAVNLGCVISVTQFTHLAQHVRFQ